jgi:hypothetical protein
MTHLVRSLVMNRHVFTIAPFPVYLSLCQTVNTAWLAEFSVWLVCQGDRLFFLVENFLLIISTTYQGCNSNQPPVFCHHSLFCNSHFLFCLSDFLLPAHNPFSCSATILYLSFLFLLLAKPILISIPPYSRRLDKIKKIHMAPRGFKPTTSQANASSSYRSTPHVCLCLHL